VPRTTKDVHESPKLSHLEDQCPGSEAAQIQVFQVEQLTCLRVGAEIDLEPAIEQEPVLDVGADPPADVIRTFQ
jgi:hypothetical protein